MSIFEKFYQAIDKAIADYKLQKSTNRETIPAARLLDLEKLQAILIKSQQKRDAGWLRYKLFVYLQALNVGFWAWIPWFDSELRKKIRDVLENPKFSKEVLERKERLELRQKISIAENRNAEKSQEIAVLKESLSFLSTELAEKKQDFALLEEENIGLQGALLTLVTEGKISNDASANELFKVLQKTISTQKSAIEALQQENTELKHLESMETSAPRTTSRISLHV